MQLSEEAIDDVGRCMLVRVTCSLLEKPRIDALLAKINVEHPYLCVYETGDSEAPNPHYHIAGWWNLKTQPLRNLIIKTFGAGNENYSIKKACLDKLDDHWTYLCKGRGPQEEKAPNVIAGHKSLDPAFVKDRQERYWKVREEAEETRRKAKRSREEPAGEQIERICRSKVAFGQSLSRNDIGKICIQWFMANRKQINEFHLKAVFNWVCVVHFDRSHGNVEQSHHFRYLMDRIGCDVP